MCCSYGFGAEGSYMCCSCGFAVTELMGKPQRRGDRAAQLRSALRPQSHKPTPASLTVLGPDVRLVGGRPVTEPEASR